MLNLLNEKKLDFIFRKCMENGSHQFWYQITFGILNT